MDLFNDKKTNQRSESNCQKLLYINISPKIFPFRQKSSQITLFPKLQKNPSWPKSPVFREFPKIFAILILVRNFPTADKCLQIQRKSSKGADPQDITHCDVGHHEPVDAWTASGKLLRYQTPVEHTHAQTTCRTQPTLQFTFPVFIHSPGNFSLMVLQVP